MNWIPCSKSMPPDLQAVLCACTETDDGLGPAIYAGFRCEGRWISQDMSGRGDPIENGIAFPVSHWTPLPPPPGKEEQPRKVKLPQRWTEASCDDEMYLKEMEGGEWMKTDEVIAALKAAGVGVE